MLGVFGYDSYTVATPVRMYIYIIRICDAVHQYYMEQFVDRWKKKPSKSPVQLQLLQPCLLKGMISLRLSY